MKIPLIQKINKYMNVPIIIIPSLSLVAIITTSFLPMSLANQYHENKAYALSNTDQAGNVTAVQDEYGSEPSVTIPTEAPSLTDIMPDATTTESAPYESVVGTIVSESLMQTNQKGHPVSMQVQRQMQDNEYMQDTAKIDVKEAALTVDMLRRDTGNTAYLSMPAPSKIPPAAELSVVMTNRAQKMFANSQLGISVQAWHGKMTIPHQTLQAENTDITIRLRTDQQIESPQGALGIPLQFLVSSMNSKQDVWIVLPLPEKKLTKSQLSHLAICAEYEDGTHKYLKGTLTDYNKSTQGIQFATHQSGNYTVVNMQQISSK